MLSTRLCEFLYQLFMTFHFVPSVNSLTEFSWINWLLLLYEYVVIDSPFEYLSTVLISRSKFIPLISGVALSCCFLHLKRKEQASKIISRRYLISTKVDLFKVTNVFDQCVP